MRSIQLFIFSIVIITLSVSCENDYSFRGSADSISFSADTLSFDTIFTGERTTTAKLLIYNISSDDMTVENIYLKGGESSQFSVNINGISDTHVTNVRLQSKDSLYVFIDVNPLETNDIEPYILEDKIIVETGGNTWEAVIIAYGQNVTRVCGTLTDLHWTEGMPYLITSTATVDSASNLIVDAGTRICFAEDASLQIYGQLNINGTLDNQVVIKGNRFEEFYDNIPGQWNCIAIEIGSTENSIEYAEISNALYCLTVDSAAQIDINNVILRDASHGAILAFDADINITNSILYNCGGSLVAMYGGRMSMLHCTLSNYFSWETRSDATFYATAASQYPEIESLTIANSIIIGNLSNELQLDSVSTESATITNSYIRLKSESQISDDERFIDVTIGSLPGFVDRSNYNFQLSANAAARDIGSADFSADAQTDFLGNSRLSDDAPDAGAFEYLTYDE